MEEPQARKRAFDAVKDHSNLFSGLERDGLEIKCWSCDLVKASPFIDQVWQMVDRMKPAYLQHGWDWSSKEEELLSEGMHFVLLIKNQHLAGFAAFLLDEEDEQWVAYCYEIHVADTCKGNGFGRLLVQCLDHVARQTGMVGTMLTCFKDNDAMHFYQRTGFVVAEHSPSMHDDPDCPYEILARFL